MGKILLPGISSTDRTNLVLDEKELVYDLNNKQVYVGNGTASGGVAIGGINAINVSAGTISNNVTNIVFSNLNNVSFGLDGSTITASISVPTNSFNILAAGTQTANSTGTVKFSNSNGISFGMSNNSIITASHNAITTARASNDGIGLNSAGTNITWSINSNGISINNAGLAGTGTSATNASVTLNSNGLAISVAPAVTTAGLISAIKLSAGTLSSNRTDISFIDGNGVSFGLDTNGQITGSVKTDYQSSGAYLTTARASNDAIGLNTAGTNVTWTVNSNGISLNGSGYAGTGTTLALTNATGTLNQNSNGIALSLSVNSAAAASINISAGTTSNNASNFTFANSNGVSFGLNAGTITASHNGLTTQSAQAFSADASSTFQTLVFQDSNGVSFSNNAGNLRVTHALQYTSNTSNITSNALHTSSPRVNISAGTTSNNLSNFVFANANNFSFGLNGSTITGSYTVPTVTNSSFSIQDSATTLNPVARIAFSTGNNITLSLSTGASSATVGIQHNLAGTSTGFGGNLISASMTHNSSGLNLSLNHPAWLTTAMQSNAVTISNINISGGTTSSNLSAFQFVNSNGVSWSLDTGSKVYATVKTDYLTTAMQSNAATISNIKVSAGTLSSNRSDISFNNSNGISFGLETNGIITATVRTDYQSAGAYLTTAAQSNQVVNSINGSTGQISFNVGSSLSSSTNGSSITFGLASNITTALQSVGAYLTTARASTDAIGLNTAQTNVTWTVNSSGLSLNAAGYAGTATTFNGTNVSASITLNSNGLNMALSAPTPGGGAAINVSAGTTSGNLQTVQFNDGNGVSFGLNGSTVTASHAVLISAGGAFTNVSNFSFSAANGISWGINGSTITGSVIPPSTLSTYEPYPVQGLSTVLVGVPTATSAAVSLYPFVIEEYVSAGIMNMAFSMAFLTVGTSSGRQTMGMAMALYSRNVSTLSSIVSTSFSLGVTGNNSSYTINQPTTTNFNGFGANADTNSAGSNISSGYTGMKLIGFPINTLLAPGNYWLGLIGTNSTSSINVGISMSHMGAAMATGLSALAPIGSFSSAYTSGQSPIGGRWNIGQGSWSSVGSVTNVPASINFASVSAVGLTYPLVRFWST